MATHPPLPPARAGQDWLLSCTPDPAEIQRAWDAQQLAAIPTGPHWLVAEASLTRSLEAVRRMDAAPHGPVLADTRRGLAWWLLPTGLANELDDVAGLTVHPAGWLLECPAVVRFFGGRWWLESPDGTGQLTDTTLLGAAFGPGGYRPDTEALS
ncbi:hypothetical protein AB0F30_33190 [Streptomyces sp. NPDC029006]|uniref:hypothetical protein n=1 Tax=Streptomyces sp. NPDC029006 TaxID=3155467 RepID=UPI0033C80661